MPQVVTQSPLTVFLKQVLLLVIENFITPETTLIKNHLMPWFFGSQVTVTSGDFDVDGTVSRNTKSFGYITSNCFFSCSNVYSLIALFYCYLSTATQKQCCRKNGSTELFHLINCSNKKVYCTQTEWKMGNKGTISKSSYAAHTYPAHWMTLQ